MNTPFKIPYLVIFAMFFISVSCDTQVVAIEKNASESIKLEDAIAHVKDETHVKTERGLILPYIESDKLAFLGNRKSIKFQIIEPYL